MLNAALCLVNDKVLGKHDAGNDCTSRVCAPHSALSEKRGEWFLDELGMIKPPQSPRLVLSATLQGCSARGQKGGCREPLHCLPHSLPNG